MAQIAKESYESNLEPVDFNDIDHIVFSGMDGSGAIGDLFSAILSKTDGAVLSGIDPSPINSINFVKSRL